MFVPQLFRHICYVCHALLKFCTGVVHFMFIDIFHYRITEKCLKAMLYFETVDKKFTGELLYRSYFKVMLIEVSFNVVQQINISPAEPGPGISKLMPA